LFSSARTTPTTREADLPPARQLGGERRARPQAQRVGQAEADLDLAGPADAPPRGERRGLEPGVVAGVGDEPERFAQPEGVGGVDGIARAGRLDAGDAADRGQQVLGRLHRELVALAHGAGVVAQSLQEGGEGEHQGDDAGAHRDRCHGRGPAAAGGGPEPRAESEQPAARLAARSPSARHQLAAPAQDLGGRPPRSAPRGPGRCGNHDGHAHRQRTGERREQIPAGRLLVQRREQAR
jgi:hypothetical protein